MFNDDDDDVVEVSTHFLHFAVGWKNFISRYFIIITFWFFWCFCRASPTIVIWEIEIQLKFSTFQPIPEMSAYPEKDAGERREHSYKINHLHLNSDER